ncbi:hypothetical protein [Marinisporobacter balticus]|uniref:Uncharacterized protein n=1 Tax=Marinisporobacter balticus TaxID=2018667 RepID=A0A4V2SA46_9FIRM|nr:hypothetical protein [Marinisporobacter balticus]TCO69490.1 hypothetical protein EV214_13114 [Marinisporobacter balticus]
MTMTKADALAILERIKNQVKEVLADGSTTGNVEENQEQHA